MHERKRWLSHIQKMQKRPARKLPGGAFGVCVLRDYFLSAYFTPQP